MPNRKSTQMRLLLFTITLVLVALCAVAVVSAAGGEPAQPVARGAPETGDRAKVTLLGPAFWLAGQEEAGLAATSNLADPTTLAVTIVSSPWALLDHNNPETQGPHVLVVEAMINNTGGTTATLPVITLDYNEDPVNNWVLLSGEDPVRKIPELPAGETYHAYWLATYPSVIGSSHVYTVTAEAQNAAPVSTSQNTFRPTADTVETRRALEGGSTRLRETYSDIVVGASFVITVEWDLGSNFQEVLLSPVGNVDFDPSSYQLVAARVTFLNDTPAPIQTTEDRLYFDTVPPGTANAQGEFVFQALRAEPSRSCPYTSPLFTSDFKYDNAYCEPGLAIEGTVSLSMTKQVSAADILQNQLLTYTITFTNNGNLPLGNVWIWDDVDPADGSVVLTSIDPPSSPAWTNDQRVAWQVGGITPAGQPGSTGTLSFAIDVNGGGNDLLDQHKILNDVFFGTSAVDLPAYAALTHTVTTTVQAPTITVAKTDGLETVNAGGELTYTLRITNTGSVTATNVVVTDLLPSGVTYAGGPNPSWNLAPIPPSGGYRVITVPVTVAPLLADGSTLTNIMTATYENEAGWAFDPKTATDDTTINAPFWVLTKSDDPATVLAGEILTYTLSYYHNGLEVAQDVNITDTLPADVVYGGLVSQPAGWTGPTTDPGPPATLNWYRPTLAAGASGSMVFTVTVPSDAGGLITNQALLTSTTPTTYTMASEDTTVNTQADLSIEKSGDPAAVLAGETLTYTLTVDNAGPSDAQNVTVTDTLPANVSVVSVEPVTSTQTGQTLTWDLASLPSGESRTFTITVAVDPAASGSLVNDAEVSSETDDPDPTFNTDSLTTPVNTEADLSIDKGGDPATVVAGETLTYTLKVDNDGPSDAQNVTVTDTLPADVTIVSVEPVTSTQTGQTLTWDLASLPSGESRTFTITVAVDPAASGSLVNNAEVSSETDDPDPTYNTDSLTTPVNTEADLSIDKSGDPATVVAGETLTYTLTVDNAGPSDAQNVTVSDTLPAGTSVVSAEPTPSSQTGQTVTWDLTSLPNGESRTFTITVTVDPAASGSLVNNAEVSSATDDPDPTYNTDSLTTPVNTEADLAIQKSDDPDPVAAGATLVYTLVYTNYGPSDAQEVYLTDTLDANVTYGGVVSAPPIWGAPTYDPGPPATLTWYAATIAGEASDSIVFTVTVNADAIGSLLNSAAVTSSTPDDTTGNNSDVEDTDVGDPTRATIYGYVFADTNCNGEWDNGEQPIPDVSINLSGPGAPQDPATTRSDGLYFFVVDTPGVYSVMEQDPDGYYSTSPNEVHVNVTLGNSYRVDFSDGQSETCAAIFGTVFEDLDSQGDWDALELGLEYVTITLNAGATALTDAYGAYTFPTTATGMHTVVETDPEGYMSTTPNEVDVDVALGNGYEVNFGDVQFCTCLGDAYEEDDDWTQAVELGVGVELSQAHDFCDDATDWTYFPARAGWIYTITTSSWGQRADTFLYLYDRDGQTLLAANDDYEDTDEYSSRIVWQPQYSGVYYILTANRAGLTGCQSDYDIWIEPLERGHIYLPVIMRGASPPVTEPDETGPALVQESAAPPAEVEPEPSPPEVVEVVLAPRGIITHTCPDSYEVDDTWQEAKPVEEGVLQVHSFDSNPVEWAADKDFLSFYLESERTITFTVPTITGTATLLELHDDNGDSLDVTGTDELVWQSPADGTYYLSVSPRLAAYGCADVAGYELVADLSPREVVYLPLIMRSW